MVASAFSKETIMGIAQDFRKWRRYRRTVNELRAMSTRNLNDMGIARWRVEDVARGHGFDPQEVR